MTYKVILCYLNPIRWFKGLFSYFLTFFLLLNRFFAVIFGCMVLLFIIWFFYDRYSNFTYGDAADSSSYKVNVLQRTEKYNSPLSQSNKELSKKLNAFYMSKLKADEERKEQEELEAQKAAEQKQRASLNPNAAQTQRAMTDYQEQRATPASYRPYKSIQSEVQRRLGRKRK